MTFTYTGTQTTDLDKVRSYIADKVSNSGPRPGGGNFTDEEITGFISTEGNWHRAVAALFDVLAGEFADEVDITVGLRHESLSQTAKQYEAKAIRWRRQYGLARSGVGSRFVTKVDGYSSDIAADEV